MKIYTIYRATNKINNKSYIGFDSNWPMRRNKHKHDYKKSNLKFYNAIKKHGWDNFEWSVLYQSLDGQYCLKVMEPFFIEEYDSFNKGYNLTLGGEGVLGYTHSEERKLKCSVPSIGRKHSEDEKTRRAQSIRNFWADKKKVISKEQREKISNSLLGSVPWNKGKKTAQKTASRVAVSINGVRYESKLEAMNDLKLSLYKLNKLIKKD